MNKNHMAHWKAFCEATQRNPESSGIASDATGVCSVEDIKREQQTLGEFASFVLFASRKNSKEFNSVDYADQVISLVRSHSGETKGRRKRAYALQQCLQALARTLKWLGKLASSRKKVRLPILQHQLREIKQRVDLKGNHNHRTLWAL